MVSSSSMLLDNRKKGFLQNGVENRFDRARASLEIFLRKQSEYTSKLRERAERFFIDHFGRRYSGEAYQALRRYVLGGKFLREGFAIEAYLGTGGKNLSDFLDPTLALTMKESASLMQDDSYDHHDVRRGGDAMHVVFQKLYQELVGETKNAIEYGNSQAVLISQDVVLAGLDAIFDSAFARDSKNLDRTLRAIRIWRETYGMLVAGERRDIDYSARKLVGSLTPKDWLALVKEKTQPLFSAAIELGLIYSGAFENKELVDRFKKFVRYSIAAFQGRDDFLGIFGDPSKTGKPNTTDITQGTANLYIILAYQSADESQKRKLDAYVGTGPGQTKAETERKCEIVRNIIMETGAFDRAQNFIRRSTNLALANLEKIPRLAESSKRYFEGATIFLVEREK
jgi:geranylgeranyl diphosphate synthase type I